MSDRATITIDLGKIRDNARQIVSALPGIDVVGVTKVTCGTPEVARAMLDGGVTALGESRLENVERMRAAGINAPVWLVRSPTPGVAAEAVALAQVSLVSEVAVAGALDVAAESADVRHGIVAMVDLGDLREGMWPDALSGFLDAVAGMRHLDIVGIGASLTCYGAIVPDEDNLGLLCRLADEAALRLGRSIHVSGGSSTSIAPLMAGIGRGVIDNVRLGEAIVLGVDPATREGIPGLHLHTDALVVSAPVIECAVKPSKPIGTAAQDAFGNVPSFPDLGMRRRAICALGRQDAPPEGLVPLDPGVRVLGASSDHLVLDVEDMAGPPRIGDDLRFVPGYGATLALFTSPYVEKTLISS
jgi:predicted amino acid racemase